MFGKVWLFFYWHIAEYVSTINYFVNTDNIDGLQTCVDSEVLVLLTRRVAAAPTRVAATATEAAVSGSAKETVDTLLPCNCDFTSIQELK